MTTLRSLPDQPSLESLRKQAKKLARERELSLRDAQLMLAREYGFAGWQALRAEVLKRLGSGLEWAAGQAERAIHDNDVERLKQLLVDYPALLSWRQSFVMRQLASAIHANDLSVFARWLQSDAYFIGASYVDFQVTLLEQAAWDDRGPFIEHLLALDPAILHCSTPPKSSALVFALEYGNAHLVPLLTRIWPLPDDLPHAVGVGDVARVKCWFDESGQPALGNPSNHYPCNNAQVRSNLHWGVPNVQQVLDVALAWACMNRQLDIASFLLEHGANINTNWSTHEPASILHECAVRNNYEAAQFLIDHGIDMTIHDHRWNATAEGWAYHAAKNEAMANFLAEAERRRQSKG